MVIISYTYDSADYNMDGLADVLLCGATQVAPLSPAPVSVLYRQVANHSFVADSTFIAPGLYDGVVSLYVILLCSWDYSLSLSEVF